MLQISIGGMAAHQYLLPPSIKDLANTGKMKYSTRNLLTEKPNVFHCQNCADTNIKREGIEKRDDAEVFRFEIVLGKDHLESTVSGYFKQAKKDATELITSTVDDYPTSQPKNQLGSGADLTSISTSEFNLMKGVLPVALTPSEAYCLTLVVICASALVVFILTGRWKKHLQQQVSSPSACAQRTRVLAPAPIQHNSSEAATMEATYGKATGAEALTSLSLASNNKGALSRCSSVESICTATSTTTCASDRNSLAFAGVQRSRSRAGSRSDSHDWDMYDYLPELSGEIVMDNPFFADPDPYNHSAPFLLQTQGTSGSARSYSKDLANPALSRTNSAFKGGSAAIENSSRKDVLGAGGQRVVVVAGKRSKQHSKSSFRKRKSRPHPDPHNQIQNDKTGCSVDAWSTSDLQYRQQQNLRQQSVLGVPAGNRGTKDAPADCIGGVDAVVSPVDVKATGAAEGCGTSALDLGADMDLDLGGIYEGPQRDTWDKNPRLPSFFIEKNPLLPSSPDGGSPCESPIPDSEHVEKNPLLPSSPDGGSPCESPIPDSEHVEKNPLLPSSPDGGSPCESPIPDSEHVEKNPLLPSSPDGGSPCESPIPDSEHDAEEGVAIPKENPHIQQAPLRQQQREQSTWAGSREESGDGQGSDLQQQTELCSDFILEVVEELSQPGTPPSPFGALTMSTLSHSGELHILAASLAAASAAASPPATNADGSSPASPPATNADGSSLSGPPTQSKQADPEVPAESVRLGRVRRLVEQFSPAGAPVLSERRSSRSRSKSSSNSSSSFADASAEPQVRAADRGAASPTRIKESPYIKTHADICFPKASSPSSFSASFASSTPATSHVAGSGFRAVPRSPCRSNAGNAACTPAGAASSAAPSTPLSEILHRRRSFDKALYDRLIRSSTCLKHPAPRPDSVSASTSTPASSSASGLQSRGADEGSQIDAGAEAVLNTRANTGVLDKQSASPSAASRRARHRSRYRDYTSGAGATPSSSTTCLSSSGDAECGSNSGERGSDSDADDETSAKNQGEGQRLSTVDSNFSPAASHAIFASPTAAGAALVSTPVLSLSSASADAACADAASADAASADAASANAASADAASADSLAASSVELDNMSSCSGYTTASAISYSLDPRVQAGLVKKTGRSGAESRQGGSHATPSAPFAHPISATAAGESNCLTYK